MWWRRVKSRCLDSGRGPIAETAQDWKVTGLMPDTSKFFSDKSAILKFAYSEKDCDALRGLKMDRVFGFKKTSTGHRMPSWFLSSVLWIMKNVDQSSSFRRDSYQSWLKKNITGVAISRTRSRVMRWNMNNAVTHLRHFWGKKRRWRERNTLIGRKKEKCRLW